MGQFINMTPLLLCNNFILWFILVMSFYASLAVEEVHDEAILCRFCGSKISYARHIISDKLSLESVYTFNDTLFTKHEVIVQTLPGDLYIDFPIVTFRNTICTGVGEWQESTWFPEHLSRPCSCLKCDSYLGWVFRPTNPNRRLSETFFGVIFTNIIGETFTNSLVVYPQN